MEKRISKASMSLRVPTQRWLDAGLFEELLGLLDLNPGVVDDLALFPAFTHPPIPLETVTGYAPILKERMAAARARGYACGVNILATMGHHNENLSHSLQGDYARSTDIDGNTCAGSFCPNDAAYVAEYVVPLYTAVAQAQPDFIWIDDDVRSGHGGIGPDCFCEHCLAEFSKLCGTLYSRESLAAAFAAENEKAVLALKKQWLQVKRRTINRLFETVETAVHRIGPAIKLGFMTGERFADGYGFREQARILAGEQQREVMWRPGGGFYRDTAPAGMTQKAHEIGRQVSLLPPGVRVIQSEIENFNYEALGKSIVMNTAEAAVYIAAGCTGAALNIMNLYEDVALEKGELIRQFAKQRPFYDALASAVERKPTRGIFTGWSPDGEAVKNLRAGAAYNLPAHFADEWFEIGLPAAYSPEGACLTLLGGLLPLAFDENTILDFLSQGVFLDGPALDALNEAGYGELTGFRTAGCGDDDCIEVLGGHPLNAGQDGRMRDCRQSFWKSRCFYLEPTDAQAQPLARVVDYAGKTKADCCMGVFENKIGGRVCAAGYYPWSFLLSHSKSSQCRSVARWLTRDTLPAYVATLHKIGLWAREEGGETTLILLNQSMDPAEGALVKVLTQKTRLRTLNKEMREQTIDSIGGDGPYRLFRLPSVAPWSVLLAVTQ